jgi:class 3 adenylate cyclase
MSRPPDDLPKKVQDKLKLAKDAYELSHRLGMEALDEIVQVSSTGGDSGQAAPPAPNPHDKAYLKLGEGSRNATMLFMDIVGYSRLETDDDQREAIEGLNEVVRNALGEIRCDIDDLICLPTGDGMCLCFFSPEQALRAAESIQQLIDAGTGQPIQLRMGLHCGSILRVNDLKGAYNLAGDAINRTQRAMDCGDERHIICTEEAYKVFVRRRDFKASLTRLGEVEVKHGLKLDLYNYACKARNIGNPERPQKAKARPVSKGRPTRGLPKPSA